MMRFDQMRFNAAVRSAECDPPRLLAPLYRVSRRTLKRLQPRKTIHDHYEKLRQRMPDEPLGALRTATALAWRGAHGYFPAYRFHAGEFLNDEWLACVDWHKPFHRDHVSHQVMCYWVAKSILDAATPDFNFGAHTLRERCLHQVLYASECQYLRAYADQLGVFDGVAPALRPAVWEMLFEEAVFLATMYHDIGYPWQFVHNIAQQLNHSSPSALMPMQMGIRELYDAYGTRLFCYPFQDYVPPTSLQPITWRRQTEMLLQAAQAKTHGLPGALAFLYLNDTLRQYPDPLVSNARGVFCIEWAALAILMHDLQKLYCGDVSPGHPPENPQLRVRFQRDPLSFLVTLVDQIEDFCRPSAHFKACPNTVRLHYRHCCNAVEVTTGVHQPLQITYCFKQRSDFIENAVKFKPEAECDYFDPSVGYVDWTGLPIASINLRTRLEP